MQSRSTVWRRITAKVAGVFLMGSLLAACQKSDSEDNSALIQRLQGKWQVQTYIMNQYYSKSDHFNTIAVDPGDYIDFEQGEKLYLRLFSSMDTSRYTIASNNRVVIDYSDTFDVRTLTETQLVLYNKKVSSPDAYTEQTFNLKK